MAVCGDQCAHVWITYPVCMYLPRGEGEVSRMVCVSGGGLPSPCGRRRVIGFIGLIGFIGERGRDAESARVVWQLYHDATLPLT